MDVLGEDEALQQFLDGQDVRGVLESAAVDTSILERYLSSDIDPDVMLPDSPPDSSSEPCSPPQMQVGLCTLPSHHCKGLFQDTHTAPLVPQRHHATPALQVKSGSSAFTQAACDYPLPPSYVSLVENYSPSHTRTVPALYEAGLHVDVAGTCVHVAGTCVDVAGNRVDVAGNRVDVAGNRVDVAGNRVDVAGNCVDVAGSCVGATTCTTSPCVPPRAECMDSYAAPKPGLSAEISPERKRRRNSGSFDRNVEPQLQWGSSVWNKTSFSDPDGGTCETSCYEADVQGASPGTGANQLLTWDCYQPSQWSCLYNHSYQTLPPIGYHVDTDKGFNYSAPDEAFVCQKKNHFQVTVHIGMAGEPKYVATPEGPMPVESFHLKVFGIKLEAQNHHVTIEQSQSDRSKKPFWPVQVNLPGNKITKVTLGRLHFGETTANNMRKKGKPNPEQRYFLMVVGLYATVKQKNHLLVANISERIIVRASNPGQFENDSEMLWQKGQILDSVVCQGRVGINTDTPDEALVVCGNAKIMGTVMHPSDRRAKENIQEVDSTDQLRRIAQMRIVEYDYKPEFATKMGIDQVHETGIIAQEVRELLPMAVREVGDITCSDGQKIQNFLMVDKEQIFMENVGAVKQLYKLTDNLETRIQDLEVWNTRLDKPKNPGGMHSKTSSAESGKMPKNNRTPTSGPPEDPSPLKAGKEYVCEKYQDCLQHRIFQITVIMLVVIMAFCAICITSIYMLTLKDDLDYGSSTSTSTTLPDYTTTERLPTVLPTEPEPWPPNLDFSAVFYSDKVYCCPRAAPGGSRSNVTSASANPDTLETPGDISRTSEDQTWQKAQRHYSDWTNTTIQTIFITQNQQFIDHRYIDHSVSRKGNYSYQIPISKHIPPNMPVTLQMNSTELLVVHLCGYDLTEKCVASPEDILGNKFHTVPNTQGYIHQWILPVTQNYRSSYHFRIAVAGQADCSTDPNYVEILFTDYFFHFYRRCQ
ncbi:myelin regulatory factor-like protein [Brachyhypopomus gauderio]|uniref:myelin regulatory factor-like protein n=1 Tax=Brachyhypopomus gauderio TaxID=698409 RepID=UPI004043142F